MDCDPEATDLLISKISCSLFEPFLLNISVTDDEFFYQSKQLRWDPITGTVYSAGELPVPFPLSPSAHEAEDNGVEKEDSQNADEQESQLGLEEADEASIEPTLMDPPVVLDDLAQLEILKELFGKPEPTKEQPENEAVNETADEPGEEDEEDGDIEPEKAVLKKRKMSIAKWRQRVVLEGKLSMMKDQVPPDDILKRYLGKCVRIVHLMP
jgi:hypothetical protein